MGLLIGLLIGSFLNVCIYRIPNKKSIIFPPSHCIRCGEDLRPWDLIPVFSYIFTMGKCRYCGEKISPQYPIIELLNGFIYFLLYMRFGFGFIFIKYALLSSLLIVISMIDLKLQIIPNGLIIFGLITGIIFTLFNGFNRELFNYLLSFLIGGGIFLIIAIVTQGAMGGGDIKLMAVLGIWFGWKEILIITLFSFIIGAIISIVLMVLKIKGRKDYVPFGPFIAIATFIMIFYGDKILQWYLQGTLL